MNDSEFLLFVLQRHRRRLAAPLLCIIAYSAATSRSAATQGASIAISYVADYSRTSVYAPDNTNPFTGYYFGWSPSTLSVSGTPLPNGQVLQRNAWQLVDASTSGANPAYLYSLGANDRNAALASGWRLSMYAQYPSSVQSTQFLGQKPNMGLTAYLRGREYHLMLNLDAGGDLWASLYGDSSPLQLTFGGTGSAAYHNYELRSAAGSTAVEFYFDGQMKKSWTGPAVNNGHDATVQWGNSLRAGAARGALNVNYVEFAVGPFNALPGDVDLDGRVDGSDFLWWQRSFNLSHPSYVDADINDDGLVSGGDLTVWKSRFGAPGSQTATPIPEPRSAIGGALAAAIYVRRRRTATTANSRALEA